MSEAPLVELSESELLARLGKELMGAGVGFGPEDPGRYRRFAERWIETRMGEIRSAICEDLGLRAVFERDVQDRLTDASAVADALVGLHGHPPVTLLSLILLRRGYEAVCGAV